MCPSDHDSQSSAPSDKAALPDVETTRQLFDLLSDSHCHIHDDIPNIPNISKICRTSRLLLMGVDPGDWGDVERAAALNNRKDASLDLEKLSLEDAKSPQIVPAFGCHPWYAFCVSSSGVDYGVADSVDDLFDLAPTTKGEADGELEAPENESTNPGDSKVDHRKLALEILAKDLVPFAEWTATLKDYLTRNPTAIVGEIGLDKNATVRGSDGLRLNSKHQLAVVRKQLEIAAEMKRAVSLHLVNRSGWFLDLMHKFFVSTDDLKQPGEVPDGVESGKKGKKKGRAPQPSANLSKSTRKPLQMANPVWIGPPAICLHSYSGSIAFIDNLTSLPGGAGKTFYFSHSIVINSRSPSFEDRIKATPDDRLLIESDYDRPGPVDEMVLEMCKVVARVKGWTVLEAARVTRDNLERFLGNANI
jgi:Tat protein secretion system quality control protein TatD with DNase activity